MAQIVGTNGNDELEGTADNDEILGLGGSDILWGLGGHDYLDGGGGADRMFGGAGVDDYIVNNTRDVVVEENNVGELDWFDTVNATVSYTLSANVEQLWLEGNNDIDGTGNNLDNEVYGNEGDNVLRGKGGDDILGGGGGEDTMYGGTGDDHFIVDDENDEVIEWSGEGRDEVFTFTSFTLGSNVEDLIAIIGDGIPHDSLELTGNGRANAIAGNGYGSVLRGLGGNDTFWVSGDDLAYGGNGNDTFYADAGHLYGGAGADKFGFGIDYGTVTTPVIEDFSASQGDRILFARNQLPELELGQLSEDVFIAGSVATTDDHRIIYDRSIGTLYYDADGSGDSEQVVLGTFDNEPSLAARHFTVIADFPTSPNAF